jgi:hypothetical protein
VIHLDVAWWQLFALLAGMYGAAIAFNRLCDALVIGARSLKADLLYEVQPEPEVQVVEVIAPPRPDLLPPAPVTLTEAPIFASVPFTLPMGMDFGFHWVQPLMLPTGEFPIIEAAEPKARERFATKPPKRKGGKRTVTVDVAGDVRSGELAEVAS